jgi:hypothetical protein
VDLGHSIKQVNMNNQPINYNNLLKTIDFFKSHGYTYIEVPWLVSKEAIQVTFSGDEIPKLQDKYIVGSGEQSFIQLQIENKLPPGKYIALTPCFRDEKIINNITQLSFMKAELYITDLVTDRYFNSYNEVFSLCKILYKELQSHSSNIKNTSILKTEEGHDILINDIEVGSYGFRNYKGTTWIYGTALAEPRFSTVIGME